MKIFQIDKKMYPTYILRIIELYSELVSSQHWRLILKTEHNPINCYTITDKQKNDMHVLAMNNQYVCKWK